MLIPYLVFHSVYVSCSMLNMLCHVLLIFSHIFFLAIASLFFLSMSFLVHCYFLWVHKCGKYWLNVCILAFSCSFVMSWVWQTILQLHVSVTDILPIQTWDGMGYLVKLQLGQKFSLGASLPLLPSSSSLCLDWCIGPYFIKSPNQCLIRFFFFSMLSIHCLCVYLEALFVW